MLHGLERTDRASELHPHLRVLDGHVENLLCSTDALGSTSIAVVFCNPRSKGAQPPSTASHNCVRAELHAVERDLAPASVVSIVLCCLMVTPAASASTTNSVDVAGRSCCDDHVSATCASGTKSVVRP